jgi:hypothetical protein
LIGSSGTLILQTWTDSVKTIIEQSYHSLPYVNPGTLSTASSDMYFTNFGITGYVLVPSDYISYEFTFRLLNSIGDNGRIDINFPFVIDYCLPYIGFNDLSSTSLTTCNITGAVLTVQNIKGISAGTLVTVVVRGNNPSSASNFEI